jgi:uncharacterized protein YbjT (DUF2867 family)
MDQGFCIHHPSRGGGHRHPRFVIEFGAGSGATLRPKEVRTLPRGSAAPAAERSRLGGLRFEPTAKVGIRWARGLPQENTLADVPSRRFQLETRAQSLHREGLLCADHRRSLKPSGKGDTLKIVVIGGTGLIGSKLVDKLRDHGHQVVPASPNSGVNTLTGEGLAEVLDGASVAVDVSNSPSFDDAAVLEFFETSTRNLLKAEASAGVGHHVALSVVGTERLSESGYFRAKIAQERLIKESSIPYSIVHATQFFEFIRGIADAATVGNTVRLAPVLIQPMAAEDVASAVGRISLGSPVNGIVEVAGPQQFRLDELIRQDLSARHDPRKVITDSPARYFGAELGERTLVPGKDASLAKTRFEDWLSQSAISKPWEGKHETRADPSERDSPERGSHCGSPRAKGLGDAAERETPSLRQCLHASRRTADAGR